MMFFRTSPEVTEYDYEHIFPFERNIVFSRTFSEVTEYDYGHICPFERNVMFLEQFQKSQNLMMHYQQCFCCTEIQK